MARSSLINKIINRCKGKIVATALLISISQASHAEQAEWLGFARSLDKTNQQMIKTALKEFQVNVELSVAKTRDMRVMILGEAYDNQGSVEELAQNKEVTAERWMYDLTRVSRHVASQQVLAECRYDQRPGIYECTKIPPPIVGDEQLAYQPEVTLVAPIPSLGLADADDVDVQLSEPVALEQKFHDVEKNKSELNIKLFRGTSGIVTTENSKIHLQKLDVAHILRMNSEVQKTYVSMFIRDPSVATVDADKRAITGRQPGVTELFVVSKDRISIISVTVGATPVQPMVATLKGSKQTKQNSNDFKVPQELASLDSLDKASQGNRAFYNQNSAARSDSTPEDDSLKVPAELTKTTINGADAVAFSHGVSKTAFQKVFLRLIDERSTWDLTQVYPVGGMKVKIVGTEFQTRSDGSGYVELPEVPIHGRIFVEIRDDLGAMMPAFAEVLADKNNSKKTQSTTVMLRRYLSIDYSARLAGVVQSMEKSSFCATLVNNNSQKNPVKGAQVGLDPVGQGPFYFNKMGYVDTKLAATDHNGRFCFFNVTPGPLNLGLRYERDTGTVHGSVVVTTSPGQHTEEMIAVDESRHVTTTIASVATASEQLSSDLNRANQYFLSDYAEVLPIGYYEPMSLIDDGMFTSTTPLIPLRARVWAVSSSSDHEVSVQATSMSVPGTRQITSLLPRGFVDDMATYANTTHEYEQSVVVVEHAKVEGQGSEPVKIRLVDSFGKPAGDGWYFSDNPVSKAAFFNVPPGVYSLIVETSSGHWIAADTLVTYPETSTFVRTGSPLQKQSIQSSAQN